MSQQAVACARVLTGNTRLPRSVPFIMSVCTMPMPTMASNP